MSATAKASSASGKPAKKSAKKGTTLDVVRSQNAKKQWDARTQTDLEVRQYFLDCDHGAGLQQLQDMRRQLDIAGKAYDENITRSTEEKCANCGKSVGPNFPWYNRQPVKNMATGVTHNTFTCSLACFVAVHGKDGKAQQQAPRSH